MTHPLHAGIYPRPEWSMIGVRWPDEKLPCMLIASARWTDAELRVSWDWIDIWDGLVAVDRRLRSKTAEIRLRGDPEDLIFIQAASWGECIEELFRQWSPEHGRTREVEGRKAIGDG